jgi:hypothetical protein
VFAPPSLAVYTLVVREGVANEDTGEATLRSGSERKRKALRLYCEVFREIGALVIVFAQLDVVFGGAKVSSWTLWGWVVLGVLVLLLGVHLDPEVRK